MNHRHHAKIIFASLLTLTCITGVPLHAATDRSLFIETEPKDAKVFLGERLLGTNSPIVTPDKIKFDKRFPLTLRVERDGYATWVDELTEDRVKIAAPKTKDTWNIRVTLEQVRVVLPVTFKCNMDGAEVWIDGKNVGIVPLRHNVEFSRDPSTKQWDARVVQVRKSGYRGKVPNTKPDPAATVPFTLVLQKLDAEKGFVEAELEEQKVFSTPIYRFDFSAGAPAFLVENSFSDDDKGTESSFVVRKRSEFRAHEIIDTRLWVRTNSQDVIYSAPKTLLPSPTNLLERAGAMSLPAGGLIMTLRALEDGNKVEVNADGRNIDIDACLSPKGDKIYFASNRGAGGTRFVICRMNSDGTGGVERFPESGSSLYDIEPTISPDGDRLAFVRKEVGKDEMILVCPANGGPTREIHAGRNPAWSPDGKTLAFIASDEQGRKKLMLKAVEGNATVKTLTQGDYNARHPSWTPDGKTIVYCSDESVDPTTRIRNWDIYQIGVDGKGKRNLTSGVSHDERPVVSPDGKHVFFLSNRGARDGTKTFLQIWQLELTSR